MTNNTNYAEALDPVLNSMLTFLKHFEPLKSLDHLKFNHTTCLYHYASIETLLSILSNKVIHATNIHFLNDSTELNYGRNLIIDELNKKISSYEFVEPLLHYYESFLPSSYLKPSGVSIDYEKDTRSTYFVVSLSEEPDNLTLWRLYGNNCLGCSIGMTFRGITAKHISETETTKSTSITPLLFKVIYNDSEQRAAVSHYLENIEKYRITQQLSHEEIHVYAYFISESLNLLATVFKPSYFCDEKEVRLVIKTNHDKKITKFKVSGAIIKPYIEITSSLDKDHNLPAFVTSIHLAPNSKFEHLEMALLDMIRKDSKSPFPKNIIFKSKIAPLVL